MASHLQHHHAAANREDEGGDPMRRILDDIVAHTEVDDVVDPHGEADCAAGHGDEHVVENMMVFEMHDDENKLLCDEGGDDADDADRSHRPSDASIDGDRFVLLMPHGSLRRRRESSSLSPSAVRTSKRSLVPTPGPYQQFEKQGPSVATQTAAPPPRRSVAGGVAASSPALFAAASYAHDDAVMLAYQSSGGDLQSSSTRAAADASLNERRRSTLFDGELPSQFDTASLSSSVTSSRVSTPTPRLPRLQRHGGDGEEGGEVEEWTTVARAGDVLHAATSMSAVVRSVPVAYDPLTIVPPSDPSTKIPRVEDQERKRRRRLLVRELTDFQLLCNADRESRHRVAAEVYRQACLRVPPEQDLAHDASAVVYHSPSALRGMAHRKETHRNCCGRWKRDYKVFMRDRIDAKAAGDASNHRAAQAAECMAAEDVSSHQQEAFRAKASALMHLFWKQALEISSAVARAAVENKELDEETTDENAPQEASSTGMLGAGSRSATTPLTMTPSSCSIAKHDPVEFPHGDELRILRSADLFLAPHPSPVSEDGGGKSDPLSPLRGEPSSSSRPLSAASTSSRHTAQYFSRPPSALAAPRSVAHRGLPVGVGMMPFSRPCSAQSTASSVHHIPPSGLVGSIGGTGQPLLFLSRPTSATAWKSTAISYDPIDVLERAITPAVMASVGKSVLSSACSSAMSLASEQRRQRQQRHRPSLFEDYVVGYLTLRSRMLVGVRGILQDAERAIAMGVVEQEACAVREANARSGIEDSYSIAARVLRRNETSELQLTQSRAAVNHRNRLAVCTKETNHRLANVVDVYFDEFISDICLVEEMDMRALQTANEADAFAQLLRLASAHRDCVMATQQTHAKQRDLWKREAQSRTRLQWLEGDLWREIVAASLLSGNS